MKRFTSGSLLALPAALLCALALLPVQAETANGKKYALLVGVKDYDFHRQFKSLSFTENDVTETAKELKKAGYTVVLLTSSDDKNRPTLANIHKQLDALLAKATKNDLIVVGLAGHGMQFDKKEDSYFCPVDAQVKDTKTLLSMRAVYTKLDESKVGVGLLLVDACRDDGGPRSAKRRGIDGDKLPNPPRGVAALFSCSAEQFAWETPKFKHGVFFHFVLEGLRGKAKDEDGDVTWNSLSNYVSKKVTKTVPIEIGGGAKQEPHEMRSLSGESPVLLNLGKEEVTKENPKPPIKEEVVKGAKGKVITNSIGMKLAYIPKGKFSMGSPNDEAGRSTDEDQHDVEITKPFYLGVYEVTQGEYEKIMEENPSWFSKTGKGKLDEDTSRYPVESVSYEDAKKFCVKLSALSEEKEKKRLYRLPTEAEWEYACRGGAGLKKTPFHYGQSLSSDQANFNGNYPYGAAEKSTYLKSTCKVGSYKPNGFGLYDMHGNVWEWCSDWYGRDYYGKSPERNPRGPSEGSYRVIRGRCWLSLGGYCRCANRDRNTPTSRNNSCGCRVALVPSR